MLRGGGGGGEHQVVVWVVDLLSWKVVKFKGRFVLWWYEVVSAWIRQVFSFVVAHFAVSSLSPSPVIFSRR